MTGFFSPKLFISTESAFSPLIKMYFLIKLRCKYRLSMFVIIIDLGEATNQPTINIPWRNFTLLLDECFHVPFLIILKLLWKLNYVVWVSSSFSRKLSYNSDFEPMLSSKASKSPEIHLWKIYYLSQWNILYFILQNYVNFK